MRYFIFVFFFYSTAFAGEACVKQAKETIEACDKSSFDDVYATAFSNYPYDYKSIFDTLETCTKAVAKCYYNCKNPTISGTATVTEVTGKLKTSYGKKPHSAEIINCWGALKGFAVEVEGTCSGQMIKQKSEMDPKDEKLKELSQRCSDFTGFKDPGSEDDNLGDDYGLNNEATKIEPFVYKASDIDVKIGENNINFKDGNIQTVTTVSAGESVAPLSSQYSQPLPVGDKSKIGGTPKNLNPNTPPTAPTFPYAVLQRSTNPPSHGKPNVGKKTRKLVSSPIHKIKDEIGTNNYYAFDPSKPASQAMGNGNTGARVSGNKHTVDDQSGDAQWYKESVMGEASRGEQVAMYSSVFEINSLAINSLRAKKQTIE